jgi:hypothetical protein
MRAARSVHHDLDRVSNLGHSDPIPSGPGSSRSAVPSAPSFPTGLERVLLSLGFSEREARLYLVLLRAGPMEAREAAGSASLHRATAYRALLRLLMRGVIVGDGRTPQRFQAVGIDIIVARVGAFLREEEELNTLAVQAAKASLVPLENGRGADPARLAHGPEFLARPPSGAHPALVKVAGARRTLDVMFRPLAAPPSYRAALVQTIARLIRGGVYVRLVLDATVADRRMMERLAREGVAGSPALQVRHFTPLGAHSYVVDGARTLRFPILGILTRTGDQRPRPPPVHPDLRMAEPRGRGTEPAPQRVLLHADVHPERWPARDGARGRPVVHPTGVTPVSPPATGPALSRGGPSARRPWRRTAP